MPIHKESTLIVERLKKELGNAKIILRSASGEQEIGFLEVQWNEPSLERKRPDITVSFKIDRFQIFGLSAQGELPFLIEIEKGGIKDTKRDRESLTEFPSIVTTFIVLGGKETIRYWQKTPLEMEAKLLLYQVQKPLDLIK